MTPSCPICGSRRSAEVFRAWRQPAMLNRLYGTRAEACAAPAVDLHFRGCHDCGFVWNVAFDPASVNYSPGYVNDQSHSPAFRSHLENVRERLARIVSESRGDILEIGCGQGDFLRALCATTGRRGIGFDPAYTNAFAINESREGAARIQPEVFDIETARAQSDAYALVICRHVLEHLPDPASMLRDVAALIQPDHGCSHSHILKNVRTSPPSAIYLEVPCFDWIADHAAFFDFFHEHCSLFSLRSMRRMLEDAGFGPIRMQRVFGGQYLAVEAKIGAGAHAHRDVVSDSINFPAIAHVFRETRDAFGEELTAACEECSCLIWGAGAKGVSLVNHLHIDSAQLPLLIDIHPAKQHCFVPLTAQQVIAPEQINSMIEAPPTIFVMNPNYVNEVRQQLREADVQADVRTLERSARVAIHR